MLSLLALGVSDIVNFFSVLEFPIFIDQVFSLLILSLEQGRCDEQPDGKRREIRVKHTFLRELLSMVFIVTK